MLFTRPVGAAGLVMLCAALASGQTRPQFEVASIRPSEAQIAQVDVGVRVSGAQVRIAAMSLKDYIGVAYRVKPFQVDGPEWLAQVRFDIAAKIPEGVSAEQVPEMLQALLAERFALAFHRESREFPVYAIVEADGGTTLQPVSESPASAPAAAEPFEVAATGSGGGVSVNMGGGSSFAMGNNRIEIRRMTMTQAAELLERFVDRPLVDATQLAGRYDVTLDVPPEDYMAMMVRGAVNGGVAIPPAALRLLDGASSDPLSGPLRTFGLRLDSRRTPLEVLVVDSILRVPAEN